MSIGYDRPLYIVPFDHRASFEKGLTPPLSPDQVATVSASKQVVYDGFRLALSSSNETSGSLRAQPTRRL